jgi:hypothetical protein
MCRRLGNLGDHALVQPLPRWNEVGRSRSRECPNGMASARRRRVETCWLCARRLGTKRYANDGFAGFDSATPSSVCCARLAPMLRPSSGPRDPFGGLRPPSAVTSESYSSTAFFARVSSERSTLTSVLGLLAMIPGGAYQPRPESGPQRFRVDAGLELESEGQILCHSWSPPSMGQHPRASKRSETGSFARVRRTQRMARRKRSCSDARRSICLMYFGACARMKSSKGPAPKSFTSSGVEARSAR